MMKPLKNILVVSVNWLGDVVFSTPVYRALKDNFPGARVTALAVPRVRAVLALCPDVDDVILYDEDGEGRSLLAKIQLAAHLRAQRFDGVFILRPSFSRTLIICLAGVPVRVGFNTKNTLGLVNFPVDDRGLDERHRSDVYLLLLERSGLIVRDRACRLSVPAEGLVSADQLLQSRGIVPGQPFIVLNTGGNWDLKQWPWERFAALTQRIVLEKKIQVVLTGAIGDVERVGKVAVLSGVKPVELAGVTDLQGLAAVFLRSQCVVSSDSGPLHLASALGVRTVSVFGPTRPEITGPRGTGKAQVIFKDVGCNKAPCYYMECPNNRCMKMVEVNDVIKIF